MGDDPHVGLDDLHVDAVLLLPDDHRPPEPAVLALLLRAVRRDRVVRLARRAPLGCVGVWRREKASAALQGQVFGDGYAELKRPTTPGAWSLSC